MPKKKKDDSVVGYVVVVKGETPDEAIFETGLLGESVKECIEQAEEVFQHNTPFEVMEILVKSVHSGRVKTKEESDEDESDA